MKIFPPDGVINLESGTYCISGDVVIDGGTKLSGDDVLLIMEDGEFLVSGNAQVSLISAHKRTCKGTVDLYAHQK